MIRRSIPKRRSAPNNPNNPNQPQVDSEIEVDEEQETMGNDAAVQRMHASPPPSANPNEGAPIDPWAFDLFGGSYGSQIDDLEWDNGLKMSSEVEGGIRSKKKTTQKTQKIADGNEHFGDVNWTNQRHINTYKDSDIDLDVGVDAERTRSGSLMEWNTTVPILVVLIWAVV